MTTKSVIWFEDHLAKKDRVLLESMFSVFNTAGIKIIEAPTLTTLSNLTQGNFDPSVKGIVIDSMVGLLSHEITLETLGAPTIEINSYTVGKEIVVTMYGKRRASFFSVPQIANLRNLKTLVLSTLEVELGDWNILDEFIANGHIQYIYKHDPNMAKLLSNWLKQL